MAINNFKSSMFFMSATDFLKKNKTAIAIAIIAAVLILAVIFSSYSKMSNSASKEPILSKNASDSMPTGQVLSKNRFAIIETNKGTIKAELYEDSAPITTKNFIKLADSGFYNGLKFHRYEPGFVIQGGDPRGDGTGGSSQIIPLEINKNLTHVKGALAMARTNDPNSATSQFYITLAPAPFLDGNYAVFGKVVSGMDVVEQLRAGDKMINITISAK